MLVVLGVSVSGAGCSAQAVINTDADLAYRALAAALGNARGGPLPAGDTLVTWARQGPILFHTIQRLQSGLTSSMLRNDGLIGVLTTSIASGTPNAFDVTWRNGASAVLSRRGQVRDTMLEITGDTAVRLPLPSGPWGIAEYGMDEHLFAIALVSAQPGKKQSMTVLRPYHLRWDTVTVDVERGPRMMRIAVDAGAADASDLFGTLNGRYLGSRRLSGQAEQHPLERTALWKDWKFAVPAKQSSRSVP